MVKIIWREEAAQILEDYIDAAMAEFGRFTALRWSKEVSAFEHRLSKYPTSYPPEQILQKKEKVYRSCLIMNRRFKIVYFYDESQHSAVIVDIWDSRVNPVALRRRIK